MQVISSVKDSRGTGFHGEAEEYSHRMGHQCDLLKTGYQNCKPLHRVGGCIAVMVFNRRSTSIHKRNNRSRRKSFKVVFKAKQSHQDSAVRKLLPFYETAQPFCFFPHRLSLGRSGWECQWGSGLKKVCCKKEMWPVQSVNTQTSFLTWCVLQGLQWLHHPPSLPLEVLRGNFFWADPN